jgi:hypothetical protein
MKPFLVVATLDAGGFAVLAVDPSKRIGTGCSAIVQSLHETEAEARDAIEVDRLPTQA